MGRTGSLIDAKLLSTGAVAPGLAGMTSGTALGLLCLACVAWTIVCDRSLRSELELEGASQAIQPAMPANPPAVMTSRMSLSLDTGEDVDSSSVVNAHHEFSAPFAIPAPVGPARAASETGGTVSNRPADMPAATGGIRPVIHREAKPVSFHDVERTAVSQPARF